jgi:hypothetical protein
VIFEYEMNLTIFIGTIGEYPTDVTRFVAVHVVGGEDGSPIKLEDVNLTPV